ncbi:MAG: alkene reductase [Fusobacteriaceae bacterium]
MKIFQELKIGNMDLKNRVLMAPMTRNRADEDGVLSSEAVLYYEQRAEAGLIITEATAISEDGFAYINTPGIFNEKQMEVWRKVTQAVHNKGGKIFLQIWHPGRISHSSLIGGKTPVAPSPTNDILKTVTRDGFVDVTPAREATPEDIQRIIENFGKAAKNAIISGFDGVQIHGANGYLIDQFLKRNSNKRTDQYGGESLENRSRFLFEVLDEVVKSVGAENTSIRLTPYNCFNGVFDPDPKPLYLYIIEKLNRYNLAFLEINESSMGIEDYDPEKKSLFPTRDLRDIYRGILALNSGYDLERGEKALQEDLCDLISCGVPYIANPDLVTRFKKGYPLALPDKETFYFGGKNGYTDYPFFEYGDRLEKYV